MKLCFIGISSTLRARCTKQSTTKTAQQTTPNSTIAPKVRDLNPTGWLYPSNKKSTNPRFIKMTET